MFSPKFSFFVPCFLYTLRKRFQNEFVGGVKMLTDRLRMVFTDEEMARLVVCESESGNPQITVDVHGMRCNQADGISTTSSISRFRAFS